jgi:hypothetical protein
MPSWPGLVTDSQTKVLRAEAVAVLIEGLKAMGLRVDLVIFHPAWGELLAITDVVPGVPVLHQVEFAYPQVGADFSFDPEFTKPGWGAQSRLRHTPRLLALQDLDWDLTPACWQAEPAPMEDHERISVSQENIENNKVAPRVGAEGRLDESGITLRPGDEIVSLVARSLEPYRGIHCLLRMLPLLQQLRPQARVVIDPATAPVQEVIESGSNGLLVDFFVGEALAHSIARVLAAPTSFNSLGLSARQTVVDRYDLTTICLPQQHPLVDQLSAGQLPRPA